MVKIEKYKSMRRMVIILSAILFIVVALFACSMGILYKAIYAQYTPNEGVWYCNELDLTLSYESDVESYFVQDDEQVLCFLSSLPKDDNISVFKVNDITQHYGMPVYHPGDLLFSFTCIQLESDYFVVCDDSDNSYTFIRLK